MVSMSKIYYIKQMRTDGRPIAQVAKTLEPSGDTAYKCLRKMIPFSKAPSQERARERSRPLRADDHPPIRRGYEELAQAAPALPSAYSRDW